MLIASNVAGCCRWCYSVNFLLASWSAFGDPSVGWYHRGSFRVVCHAAWMNLDEIESNKAWLEYLYLRSWVDQIMYIMFIYQYRFNINTISQKEIYHSGVSRFRLFFFFFRSLFFTSPFMYNRYMTWYYTIQYSNFTLYKHDKVRQEVCMHVSTRSMLRAYCIASIVQVPPHPSLFWVPSLINKGR